MTIDPGSLLLGTAIGCAAGVGLCFVAAFCMAAGQADEDSERMMDEWLNERAQRRTVVEMTDTEVALWAEMHGRGN